MPRAHNQAQHDSISTSPAQEQPTNDFKATLRAAQAIRADPANEELRAQVHKLKYELESLRRDRDVTALRHADELRSAQAQTEAEYKRAQSKLDKIVEQQEEAQESWTREKQELDRKCRAALAERSTLEEQLEDVQAAIETQDRQARFEANGMKETLAKLEQTNAEAIADRDEKAKALSHALGLVKEHEETISKLESKVLELQSHSAEADSLDVVRRELSAQVEHISRLETMTTKQNNELKQYRKQKKAIEVVEEEKRMLEGKVRLMNDLRKELGEAQLQRQILEDEQKSWTAQLASIELDPDEAHITSLEHLARAFVKERLERVSLLDKLGRVAPDLTVKEATIQALTGELSKVREELAKTQAAPEVPESRARLRLERQRTLALKEVDYLRAQLKAFDAEETEFNPDQRNAEKASQIARLDELVEQYRNEVSTLHEELTKLKDSSAMPPPASKRARDDDEDDARIGELLRKNRALQDELSLLATAKNVLEKDLDAQKAQLSSLKSSSKIRVLALRDNPTTKHESVKLATLSKLRAENSALLAQLEGQQTAQTAPWATVERLQDEIEELKLSLKDGAKQTRRNLEKYTGLANDFRISTRDLIGWMINMLPDGKVKLTSTFHAGIPEEYNQGNSIIFDRKNGTMKCSGGNDSAFAREISRHIEFWIDDKNDIPCFLAACTLEFYERSKESQEEEP
ncbi:hypothetical protein MRB53_038521 [Persea americana]|nr:hypothetical protein MRB53_038521 [Persea americana]